MKLPQYIVVGLWGAYSESRTADDLRHAKKIQSGWKGRQASRLEIYKVGSFVRVEELAWERPE
ncbi:hypothetical protein ACFYW9_19470 [Streptomyces sp. NPDC002698]|uniref:hypothetical protein n=1 Tax=Streptomyces sp. NPDC002698 TaxID=3364660 RepID=UPI00369AFE73